MVLKVQVGAKGAGAKGAGPNVQVPKVEVPGGALRATLIAAALPAG